jgi:WD40 repeat protein
MSSRPSLRCSIVLHCSAAALAIVFPFGSLMRANEVNQLLKLTAPDASPHDFLGAAVGVSGNLAIVGAPQDNNPSTATGSAYVFDTKTGNKISKFTIPGSGRGEYLGTSVDIDNDVAIAGAWSERNNGVSSGGAYLFNALTASQLFKLVPSDGGQFDEFGQSVAVSGNAAIVGAPEHHPATGGTGAAYVYNVSTGQQIRELADPSLQDIDQFGYSVALSGNIAIVGSPTHDAVGTYSGAAYVFDVNSGQQLFDLAPLDPAPFDDFGWSVAIDGNIAVVGAVLKSDAGINSGAAYLFDVSTGKELWKLTPTDSAAEDHFGMSVSISGNIAVVSADRDFNVGVSGHTITRGGAAYAFDVMTGQQIAEFTGSDTAIGDRFGWAAAAGAGIAVVGAPGAATEAGRAYEFSIVPEPTSLHILAVGTALLGGLFAVGAPYVHVWVNVADDPSVKLNA